jgi:hypothetical protein
MTHPLTYLLLKWRMITATVVELICKKVIFVRTNEK